MCPLLYLPSDLVTQTRETIMNSSFFLPTDSYVPVPVLCALILRTIVALGVSLPLNVYVLWLFVTGVRNEIPSEFFSVNLCVCEILICLSEVLGVVNLHIKSENAVNSLLYFFMLFLFIMHCISRPFFQGCICVERYVAVIYPIIFLKYKPLRYRTALSLVAWIIFLGFSVFCPFLPIRNTFYYILLPEYLLAFSVKILCCIAVLKALRKPGPGEKLNEKDAESNRMKKKAFWMILIILISMFITYCPTMISMFVYGYLSVAQQDMCIMILSLFVLLGGFLDPFLYLYRVGKLPSTLGI